MEIRIIGVVVKMERFGPGMQLCVTPLIVAENEMKWQIRKMLQHLRRHQIAPFQLQRLEQRLEGQLPAVLQPALHGGHHCDGQLRLHQHDQQV